MIDQRKNASAKGGTDPARPRARIMLETCVVATRIKPTRAIAPAHPAFDATEAVVLAGL